MPDFVFNETDVPDRSDLKRILVAHYVQRHARGGMARMMESMHEHLKAFGWETEYFTADDVPLTISQRLRRHAFPWYVRRHVRTAFLGGRPYDIVNVHEPIGAAVVLGRSRLGRPAIVATSHGLEERHWRMRLDRAFGLNDPPGLKERISFPLTKLWQSRLTLVRSDHVLCLNEEDRAFVKNHYHLDFARTTRIFPGAGPEFSAAAHRRNYDRTCRKLLFSGTWIERKGIRQLAAAFTYLAETQSTLELGILGAGVSPDYVLAHFPGHLHNRIVVFPSLTHVECAEILLEYDIFLLPSFFEGTPLALLEAMCTGIPVVTTATAGMKDVVQDGQNGILVEPGDSAQIVRAIERLITYTHLRRRLGRQAFSDAAGQYTWQAVAAVVHQAYSRLLAPHSQLNL